MDNTNYEKIYSVDNRTTFINKTTNTLMIIFSKDVTCLDDIIFDDFVKLSKNDRYCKYKGHVDSNVEMLIINDYTENDFYKYTELPKISIDETPEYFNNITYPHAILIDKLWIYNILSGKSEQDRIIYQNEEFILIKDIKWSGKAINDLHLLAIPKRKDILSIRDLDNTNINLIEKIDNISKQLISEKYNIHKDQIRSYFHYYPSVWHLHIHYDLCGQLGSNDSFDICRSVHDVIENIKMKGNYYKEATLKTLKFF